MPQPMSDGVTHPLKISFATTLSTNYARWLNAVYCGRVKRGPWRLRVCMVLRYLSMTYGRNKMHTYTLSPLSREWEDTS